VTKKALLALLLLSCSKEASPLPATASDAALKHYDIRADQLPAPFATPSAGNPPNVRRQPANATLHLPPGFRISVFAEGLSDPRTMLLTPNGDVLVAEPGSDKITLLRDANHDGIAETRFTFAKNLYEPFGLALLGNYLFVGNSNSVVRFDYKPGQTSVSGAPKTITSLPPGGHSTRGLLFSQDSRRAGTKLYVSIGSQSNVNPEGPPRAAIIEMNPDGSGRRTFASGLRNPVGMAWEPASGALWTVVNERDGLGDDLVPDYATDVRDGAFYGWPYAYIGTHPDPRRNEHPELVPKSIAPSLLIESHSAPLGILFYEGAMFPAEYRGNAFIALHGSWNRARRTGYKIIRAKMKNGKPAGGYDDFVTGWMLDENSDTVWGRPVSLLVLGDGSLLISDDAGEKIWRVTYATGA
jgi:glucose/arabinose dehydrogenase